MPSLWLGAGIILNVAVALAFEAFRPQSLTYDGLWNARTGLWAGLLLFDNLAVLWWYAYTTKQQLDHSKAAFAESQRHLLIAQKPLLYVERVEDPDRRGHVTYRVRNAGAGSAVNAYYIGLAELLFSEPRAIGSVAPGDARLLPAEINRILQEGGAGIKFVIVAEAHYTRTTQWTPTLNVRTQTAGRHGGQVLYRTAEPAVPPPRFQYQSLRDYLQNNSASFAQQLSKFGKDEAAE
jgi:hypothetical protein